jgi:hypothetical protein
MLSRHEVIAASVQASPEELFARLDDQTRLAGHMSKRSWKMGWGRVNIELDGARGRAVGSHITFSGRVFGIRLSLDEVVTHREPPTYKAWQTVGSPRLLVIGAYRMAFEITPANRGVLLRVSIDYSLPSSGLPRLLGLMFGRSYARWCIAQMVRDAQVPTVSAVLEPRTA